MRRWSIFVALFASGLVFSDTAFADPKDDARRHFAAGLKAAQSENYEIALQRFLAAQEAFPHPATLYNIAKSYTDLDDLPNALTYYRLFRDASPERAGDVEPIIAVLEARLGAGTVEPGAVASAPRGTPVAGPTTEELARLSTIARELGALTEALQQRTEEDAVAVTEGDLPEGMDGGPAGEPLPEIADAGFLEDAYRRIVVTASRVGQEPLDSPSTVSILTADDIRLSGVLNLPDLLRRVAGVDVMSLTAGAPDVAIRGFNSKLTNKVLILIDGRSTYLDFLGASVWSSFPVQLEEIERIEVIRGPGSAVYGANAVTGVINIITRTPGEGEQVVRFDGGTPGLGRASAVASGRVGETAYRLAAGFERHGRWAREFNPEANPNAGVATYFDNDSLGLRTLKLNARVDRTISEDVAVSVSAGLSDTQSEFYAVGALPDYYLDMDHTYVRGDLFLQSLHLRAFWNNNVGNTGPWLRYEAGPNRLDATFVNDVVDVELEAPLQFDTGAVGHTLNVGGGYRLKRFAFSYLAGGADETYVENHFKAFLNEQISVGPFGAVLSLRADLHPLLPLDQTLSPRGALLFRLFDKTSLRATAGSAYRAPNGTESYMDLNLPTPSDGVFVADFGNRNLSPERINTFEIGLHDESTFFHTADVVVYYNQVTNLIGLDDVTIAFNPFDGGENGIEVGRTGWINLDPVYTGFGVEGEVEIYPTDGLDLFANASLMQVDEKTGPDVVREGSASQLKLNGGFSYRTPYNTDVSVSGHYLTGQSWTLRQFDPETLAIVPVRAPVDARLLVSARVGFRPLKDQDFEIAGTIWNITELVKTISDEDAGFIEHPEGHPVAGRAYATLSYRF